MAIPAGPVVVTSTITASGADPALYDFDVMTAITHTFPADLDITLTSPTGIVVTLTTDNGGDNADVFNGTLWDDQANPGGQVPYTSNAGLVTDHPYVDGTTATPLVPEEEARRLSRRLSLRGSERHLDAHDLRRHRGGCGVGWSARPGRPPHAERPSSSVSRNRPQPGGGAP